MLWMSWLLVSHIAENFKALNYYLTQLIISSMLLYFDNIKYYVAAGLI